MKKYYKELQVYAGIAILFVTLIHSNAWYLLYFLHLDSYAKAGRALYTFDNIIHIAVPMFIFIAGFKYEMNDKNEKYKNFVLKKCKNVIKPSLIISTSILLYRWLSYAIKKVILYKKVDVLSLSYNIFHDFIRTLIGYNYAFQFWYIPLYILIVLSYPIILKFLKKRSIRFVIFIALAAIYVILLPRIKFIATHPYPISFIYYLYLYELGSIFYDKKLYLRDGKPLIIMYFVILFCLGIVKNSDINFLIYNILLIPIAIVAFYFISVKLKNNKILLYLGKYSFIIFLFHEPYFIDDIAFRMQTHGIYKSWFMVPTISVMSIILSICFYELLIKTFIGKHCFNIKNNKLKETAIEN